MPDIERRELVCCEPHTPLLLAVRTRGLAPPESGQVLVQVEATSVNPIDVKRAGGYGRRLLRLKGAGSFPLVLGNDLAGTVVAVGPGVSDFAPRQRVFGVVGTAKAGGAHASHLLVPQEQLAPVPEGVDLQALATLPYCFTTMWLALRSTGLSAADAAGMRVLVNGANGGLGRLALQTLHAWGCKVTAICGRGNWEELRALQARVVERGPGRIASLPADFDVVLNFGSWEDDRALAARLGPEALGHATTVHPLLGNLDGLGWLRGGWACWRDYKRVQSVVTARGPKARYAWTVFKPDREALQALAAGIGERRYSLPVGISTSLEDAGRAFAHVAAGKRGRAVLLPGNVEALQACPASGEAATL